MKQISKRLLGALLAIIMVVSMVPLEALTASENGAASQSTITTGDIITYGSYPQTKVTDSALISALNAQTLQGDNTVTYGNSKYKRVYFTQYTPYYTTGTPNASNSYQDDNGYYINTVYWFKFEPLQWRVLSNTNGELFVMAEKILGSRAYNQVYTGVTWETCTMRSWLNDDFYNTAFNSTERAKIKTSTVVNAINPWYGTAGGNNTNDKLFLLSYSEVMNPAYGFSSDFSNYDTARRAQGTDYAKSNGLYVHNSNPYLGNSHWWLRSPGYIPHYAGFVYYDGNVYNHYISVNNTYLGARPAFKLNLTSDIFTSKANSTYNLKIVDADSSVPVAGANAAFNGGNYVSFPDGSVSFLVGVLPTGDNRLITITKTGYKTKTISLENLNPYAQTIVPLESQNSVANLLPNISTGSDKINGPDINFMGKTFPLFSIKGKVDLPFKSSLSVTNNHKEKTIRLVGGISDGFSVNPDPDDPYWSESYREVKSFVQRCGKTVDTTKLWNQYSSLRGKLKKMGTGVGLDCNGSIALYAEFDYSTGEMVLKEGGLILIAEATLSQSVPFAPAPIFYMKFELGGEIAGQLSWVFSGSGLLGPSGEIEISVKPRLGVGAGIDKIASLEVGLKGTISGKVKFNSNTLVNPVLQEMFEAYIEAKLYAKYKLLLFQDEKDWTIANVELYPNFGASKNLDISLCRDDMRMMPRDYLLTQTKRAQSNSTTVASIDKQSVYPNGSPKLTTLSNGNILALWLDDNGTKTTANRTTLFYSVYNGSVWTTPAAVCDSEFADFSAIVCTNGSNVGVLWQRGSEVFGDDVALDDMLANTDLVYSSFDGTSFSTPQVIGTPDNGKYETGYDIESDGTEITAVWIENSLNDFSLSTGTNAVYAQTLSSGVWQDVETVNANVAGISSLAVGYTGDGREIAYCADTDGDLATMGDTELFVNNTNVTNNAVDDLNIKFENGSFWFKSNGELVKLNEDYTTTNTGIAFDGNYNVIGNGTSTAAVFTQSDDFSNQVMISRLNADGTFTSPVSFYDNDTLVNAFSAIMNADGGITMAMDAKNLSTDPEAATPYTTTDFLVKEFGDSYDLQIGDSLSYDRTSVAPDADVELTTTVKNNSNVAMNGYTLTLTDGSGNYLEDKTVNESLDSGATADVSFIYTLPSTLAGHEVKLTVTPLADVIETDVTNNSVSTQIGLGDLTVAAEIEENEQGALITAIVTNSGYTTIDSSSVSFTKIATDMDLLNTSAIGSLAPGQSEVVTYQVGNDKIEFLSEYTANSFVVEASTESDENDYANNDIRAMLEPVRVESVVLNEETLVLALDETYSLNATIAPINALNKAVYFVSDSTDVVTVDDEGNLVAVGTGTAIITVLTSDGGKVSSCTITVDNNRLEAAAESQLMMSTENDFITNVDLTKATPGDLRLMIANSKLRFVDANGDELPETRMVGTGTIVQLLNNSGVLLDEKQVVIFGDVNGDGNIDSLDAGTLVDYENYIIPWDPIDDVAYKKAGDLNGDGSIDSIDAGIAADVENYRMEIDQSTGIATPVVIIINYPESEHPYADSMDKTWHYTHSQQADYLEVTFSQDTKVESSYDNIYIYDGNGNTVGSYTGTALAGQKVTIPGNSFSIRLTSDGSVTYYGYSITSVNGV